MISPADQLAALKRGVVTMHSEPELLAKLQEGRPLRIKLGFDPTSPDLTRPHPTSTSVTPSRSKKCANFKTWATTPSSSSVTSPP